MRRTHTQRQTGRTTMCRISEKIQSRITYARACACGTSMRLRGGPKYSSAGRPSQPASGGHESADGAAGRGPSGLDGRGKHGATDTHSVSHPSQTVACQRLATMQSRRGNAVCATGRVIACSSRRPAPSPPGRVLAGWGSESGCVPRIFSSRFPRAKTALTVSHGGDGKGRYG